MTVSLYVRIEHARAGPKWQHYNHFDVNIVSPNCVVRTERGAVPKTDIMRMPTHPNYNKRIERHTSGKNDAM